MDELYIDENSIPGNRPKENKNSLLDVMTAISRSLAKTQINWTPEEKKLFIMCLTKIRWSESGNSNVIELDKDEIIDALRLKMDSTDRSQYLRMAFRKLARDSEVHWTDPNDRKRWRDDFLILERKSTRGKIIVTINAKFMPHLENLVKNTPYLTIWSSDVYGFRSKFSFSLFEELRLHYDTRILTNYRTYTTKQLKEIFGLGKNDYMRPPERGGFNRTAFERSVIDVAVEEINRTQMMQILPNGTNRKGDILYYKKIKKNGFITGYEFRFFLRTKTMPNIVQDDASNDHIDEKNAEEKKSNEKSYSTADEMFRDLGIE